MRLPPFCASSWRPRLIAVNGQVLQIYYLHLPTGRPRLFIQRIELYLLRTLSEISRPKLMLSG